MNKIDLKSRLIPLEFGILAVIEGVRNTIVLILNLFRAGSVFKRYEMKWGEEEPVVTAFLRHGADSRMTRKGAAHAGMKPDETTPYKADYAPSFIATLTRQVTRLFAHRASRFQG